MCFFWQFRRFFVMSLETDSWYVLALVAKDLEVLP